MRVLGLDVGEKRIGVARADSDTRIAVPIGYIEVNGSEWQEIGRLANINGTNSFIIGLPRSNEGNETKQSLYVRKFAKTLTEKIPGARIRFQDESLTSVMAEERLRKRKKNYEKGEIDSEAASIILQDFLESIRGADTSGFSDEKTEIGKEQGTEKDGASEILKKPTELAKKEMDKVKFNTKKAKHKVKTATKWVSGGAIIIILALLLVGGALIVKEIRARERAEEFARLEAEMEENAVFSFTIRPGETIFEVREGLIEAGYSKTEVDEALESNYDYEFLRDRPEGATLEGYLYGETHEFYKTATVKEVIETFLKGMEKVIEENDLEGEYAKQGLSLYEGITLASVVQKEAPSPEQPTVAQVFLSRLSLGIPLGSDVTVSYALDKIDPERKTYTDNESALKVDSCYNTRLYPGLPCGPISNPGISALLSVANPSDTSYLYFLTGDDGMMYYSSTEAEHNQNIYSHCQNLCNVSL